MTSTTAPTPGLPPIRPALAVLAALALLATVAPPPSAEAGTKHPSRTGGHSCCCGAVCRMGCCEPEATGRDRPADPPSSAADVAALLADDRPSCVGPMPCGGDSHAPSSPGSPKERPADVPSVARLSLIAGPSSLFSSIERLRPAVPGDPPEEPPEPTPAGAAS